MAQRVDRGASLVEFALVLPILALFLFGIIQFGLGYDRKQSVNSAAREGARVASLPETTLREIGDAARGAYAAAVSGGSDPTVEVSDSAGNPNGQMNPDGSFSGADPDDASAMPCGAGDARVVVVVRTAFRPEIPFVPLGTYPIEARGEFRCE